MPRSSRSSELPKRGALAGALMLIPLLFACGSEGTPLPDLPPTDATREAPAPFGAWLGRAVDTVLDYRVWRGHRSGYVALVARDGFVVHASVTGHRDIEAEDPMTLDTRFQIASMTKPVVAAAAMILVEEGRLGLDDPVSRYVPEFASVKVAERDDDGAIVSLRPPARPIRVRDVLSFSGGLGPGMKGEGELFDQWMDHGFYLGSGRPLSERVAALAALPLFADPGEEWRYGVSMDVAARIVEVAAEEPLDRFLERRLFQPLGMRATTFYGATPAEAPLAVMYLRDGEGGLERIEGEGLRYSPRDWTPGGTGLVSTAPDYLRFALMLWNEGEYDGVRVLRPETVRAMRTPVIGGTLASLDMEGLGFGLGVSVVEEAERVLLPGHDGDFWWSGAYGTHFWISPETGLVLVVMQQRLDPDQTDPPIAPGIVQALVTD